MIPTVSIRKPQTIAIFIIVIFLIFGNQLTSIFLSQSNENYARHINLAGRQRMLSQKIAKEVLAIDSVPNAALLADVSHWKQIHYGLQLGDKVIHLEAVSSNILAREISSVNSHVESIFATIDAFTKGEISKNLLQQIVIHHERIYLDKMDQIVFRLQEEADHQNYIAETITSFIAIISIAVLILSFFLVLKPLFWKMKDQEREIKQFVEDVKLSNEIMASKVEELAHANSDLQAVEEELRMANEEQLVITEELESKIQLNNKYTNQLAVAQDMAGIGYWSYDLENKFHWSDQMYRIFNLQPNPPNPGPSMETFRESIHPQDRELFQQNVDEVYKSGEERYRFRLVNSKNQVRYLDTIIKKDIGPFGKLKGVFGITMDITDHISAKEALYSAKELAEKRGAELAKTKEILEETNAIAKLGGWELDIENNTLLWTAITREIHEVDDDYIPDLDAGINFYRSGESRITIEEVVEAAIKKGSSFCEELQIVTHKRNIKWVRAKGRAEYRNGKCIKLHGTIQDISDEVASRDELINAKEIAENAAKIKHEFLANMSHEIRTPMNAIMGFTRILLKTQQKSENLEYLQSIYDSAETLLVVINDILDFSKIESGKLTIEQTHFRLDKILSLQEKLFSIKVDESDVKLIFETDSNLKNTLVGDPVRVSQILNNLIGNAVKFTSKGHIKVTTNLLLEGDWYLVKISIEDTGIGIAQDKIKDVFNSFEQEKGDTTRLYGGTGLGLSIVKKIVELMGGEINIKSQEHVGSIFTVVLPFEIGDENLVATDDLFSENVPIEKLEGKRILVTEDNRYNQMLAEKCLSDVGCFVGIASNGKEAIRKILNETFDLILMDIQMPEMDGLETTKAIKSLSPPHSLIPIVAMTAHALKEEEKQYYAIGMCEYVSKPFNPNELYNKLIRIFNDQKKYTSSQQLHLPAPKMENTQSIPMDQIQYENLMEFSSGDQEFFKSMLKVILEDVPEMIREVEVTFQDQNWPMFKKSVHALRSSTSFMGMKNMADLITKIEKMNLDDTTLNEVEGYFEYIRQNCERAMTEVKNHLHARED